MPVSKHHQKTIDLISNYLRKNASKFIEDPNINSVGIAFKEKGAKKLNKVAVRFSVNEKLPKRSIELIGSKVIPSTIPIGSKSIPTDVVERNYLTIDQLGNTERVSIRTKRHNPILPGLSVSLTRTQDYGTLGCIVYHKGKKAILTCAHVLKKNGNVLHPALIHDQPNRHKNKIGKVSLRIPDKVDCAIAELRPEDELDRLIVEDIFGIDTPVRKAVLPKLLDKVIKSGSRTEVTHGIVTCVNMCGKNASEVDSFEGFEITPDPNFIPRTREISMKGDSGSIVMLKDQNGKPTNKAVGLLARGDIDNTPLKEFYQASYMTEIEFLTKISFTNSKLK